MALSSIDQFFNQWRKKIYKMPPPAHHLKTPVPLFDFGNHLLEQSLPEDSLWWQAPLPFPDFWFYCTRPNPKPRGSHDNKLEYMVRVETIEGQVFVTPYGKGNTDYVASGWVHYVIECWLDSDRELFEWKWRNDPGFSPKVELAGTLDGDGPELDPIGGKGIEKTEEEMMRAWSAIAKRAIYIALLGSFLLALPKTYQIEDVAMPDPRLRKLRNLRPLPPIKRIIHIDWKSVRRFASDHHTGTEVTPHDRRAHFRVLHSGRRVPVRASKVKGGGAPRSYEIRSYDWTRD